MSDVVVVCACLALAAALLALLGALRILARFTALSDIDASLRQQQPWSELQQQPAVTYPLNLSVINGIASGI